MAGRSILYRLKGGAHAAIGRLAGDQRGGMLIVVAFALPILIGALGYGIEAANLYLVHERMQNAADSGALSAARAYVLSHSSDLDQEAGMAVAEYGFTTTNGAQIAVNEPPTAGTYLGQDGYVEVVITQAQPRSFSRIFGSAEIPVSARAVARISQSPACLIALNATASGAITISGGVTVNLDNCDAHVNSNNTKALKGSGGAVLNAASAYIVGRTDLSGGSAINVTGSLQQNAQPTTDPYASVNIPPFGGCDRTNFSTSSRVTLMPGVYCNGINVSSGGNVTLSPGIYYVDRGSFNVSGGGIVRGTGVTIVFTSSTGANYPTVSISGSSVLQLSAPTSGNFAGIALYGDRNMPVGRSYTFSGGTSQQIAGALYLPRAKVTWSGGSSAYMGCTRVIGDTITFSGQAALGAQCSGLGGGGSQQVSLVE